jgi:penicillin amidase
MSSIHAEVTSVPAQALQKALKRVKGLKGAAADGAKMLLEWDCVLAVDSPAAALYEMASVKLTEAFVKAHYGRLADSLLKSFDAGAEEHWRRQLKAAVVASYESGDEALLPKGKMWGSLLTKSLEAAVAEMEKRFGKERAKWRWGDLHKTSHQHLLAGVFPEVTDLLNPPRVETAGDGDTPWASGSKTGADFVTGTGPINRYIHDPSNWSNGRWIVPLGASGHPGSPHYADQQQMWSKVETIPQLWEWDEIGKQAEAEQVLRKG